MNILKIFSDYRHIQIFILSIFSAMPLGILYKAVPAWLSDAQIGIAVITTFSVAKIFYSLKFLWSPFIDQIRIPFLGIIGHRKSWMVICLACIGFILFYMSRLDPTSELSELYGLVIALGVISATYDIVFDAFRIEKFEPELQAIGAATAGLGYRIGLITIGAGAFYLSDLYSWRETFFVISILYAVIIFYTISLNETEIAREKFNGFSLHSWKVMTIDPFADFFKRDGAILILLAIICFKLGDAMLGVVAIPFYLDLGFTKSEIAFVSGVFGVIATIIGAFAGAYLMYRIGSLNGMIVTAIFQSFTNTSFIWLNHMGHDINAFMIAIAIENIPSGMGSGVLAGYLSVLCNKKFTATQFALFTSASGLASHTIVVFGGAMVKSIGWDLYFLLTIILAIPGIFLLIYLKNKHENNN
jgi:PAT family beta-lactamase induction signal transducer AmpG